MDFQDPGQVLAKSVASCKDVDKYDILTFSIENTSYSDYFDIDNSTSAISLVKVFIFVIHLRSVDIKHLLYSIFPDIGIVGFCFQNLAESRHSSFVNIINCVSQSSHYRSNYL